MSNMLFYKDYHALVEYDADDSLFVGTVLGVRDTLAFHADSVPELTETFPNTFEPTSPSDAGATA